MVKVMAVVVVAAGMVALSAAVAAAEVCVLTWSPARGGRLPY